VAEKGNWHFQEKAIEILGKIHARPGVSIPAIVPFLQSTNSFVRFHTLVALGEFGTNTQGLVPTPDIIRALADSDDWVRRAATNTLLYLSPQAAAKAGVPLNP
jgi:HEAT repeat protein